MNVRLGARVALLASTLAAAGCAGATLGQSDEPTVELVVHNESPHTVRAFVQWQGLTPVQLGMLSPGRTVTYLPPFRSNALCVSFVRIENIATGGTVPNRAPTFECGGIEVERGVQLHAVYNPSRHGMSACYYRYDPDC
jgi:hypothetical protein